jgi:hypothetical protein
MVKLEVGSGRAMEVGLGCRMLEACGGRAVEAKVLV